MFLTLIHLPAYYRSAKQIVTEKVLFISHNEHTICIQYNGKKRRFEYPSGKQKVRFPRVKLYQRELLTMSTFTKEEAERRLQEAEGDEIVAAEFMAGEFDKHPSLIEIHHFLWIIRRAIGKPSPSFDDFRVEYNKREKQ